MDIGIILSVILLFVTIGLIIYIIQRKKNKPKKTVDKKATKSDEESRLNQIKEKIQGWKVEGYNVDELEKMANSVIVEEIK